VAAGVTLGYLRGYFTKLTHPLSFVTIAMPLVGSNAIRRGTPPVAMVRTTIRETRSMTLIPPEKEFVT
jgi:hypothetical protein